MLYTISQEQVLIMLMTKIKNTYILGANCIKEKQVKILCCPAAVMWSQFQYVTGKLGRRD